MNRAPCLPGLFSDAPVAPPSVTVSPVVRAARASGRQRAAVKGITKRMAEYRLIVRDEGPISDHDAMGYLQVPLASVNAARGDWKRWADGQGVPCPVVPFDRERYFWPDGTVTTRTRWQWQGER